MGNDTYTALSTFIQSQKLLLAQTQRDVERLQQLREDALADPDAVLHHLDDKLNDSITRLHEQPAAAAELPQEVDWSLFQSCDPAQMRLLASTVRRAHHERSLPSPKQRTPLSPLQQLVKDARRTLLDPLLSSLALSSDSSDSEEEMSAEERRKQRERAKLRELRMRRIGEGGLTLPRGLSGVHVRRDLDDESGEVTISMDDDTHRPAPPAPMAPDAPRPLQAGTSAPPEPAKAPRPPKVQSRKAGGAARTGPSKAKVKRAPEHDDLAGADAPSAKRAKGTGKPRPDTYKQAWSVSEQHLLERLLDEIPDGEKNRWAKISKAMGGRRTPRQVASRVQKYFEKLRRFGVEIGGGSKRETEEPE